jgi:hypothetical protein
MKFVYNEQYGGKYLLLNGAIVGWIVKVGNGQWSYTLRTDNNIDAPIFETEHEADLALLCVFGE